MFESRCGIKRSRFQGHEILITVCSYWQKYEYCYNVNHHQLISWAYYTKSVALLILLYIYMYRQ